MGISYAAYVKTENAINTIPTANTMMTHGTAIIIIASGIKNNKITNFDNENRNTDTYVNGGFFIIDKSAIKKIKKSSTYWEQEPLNFFAKKKQLHAFKHEGFWKSLDTLKDKNDFNKLYNEKKKSPWKI